MITDASSRTVRACIPTYRAQSHATWMVLPASVSGASAKRTRAKLSCVTTAIYAPRAGATSYTGRAASIRDVPAINAPLAPATRQTDRAPILQRPTERRAASAVKESASTVFARAHRGTFAFAFRRKPTSAACHDPAAQCATWRRLRCSRSRAPISRPTDKCRTCAPHASIPLQNRAPTWHA